MAQLHRRILRFSYCALVSLWLAFPFGVSAEVSRQNIEELAQGLRDPQQRSDAVRELSHLPAAALPAIAERLEYTRRQVIPPEDANEALTRFRRATGSRRADDRVDLADGIEAALAERADPTTCRMAERVLLLRSLERINSYESMTLIPNVFALTPEAWLWERRHFLARKGRAAIPTLILARKQEDSALRDWSRSASEALGFDSPAAVFQSAAAEELPALVRSYTEVRDLDALVVFISYVDSDDQALRTLVRESIRAYGQNAIWQLRIVFEHKLGEQAVPEWGVTRTLEELERRLDERTHAPFLEALARAQSELSESPENARDLLNAALRDDPMPPRREEVAEVYATLAEALNEKLLLRRALWLAPTHARAAEWTASLAPAPTENLVARVAAPKTGHPRWLWLIVLSLGLALALAAKAGWSLRRAAAADIGGASSVDDDTTLRDEDAPQMTLADVEPEGFSDLVRPSRKIADWVPATLKSFILEKYWTFRRVPASTRLRRMSSSPRIAHAKTPMVPQAKATASALPLSLLIKEEAEQNSVDR